MDLNSNNNIIVRKPCLLFLREIKIINFDYNNLLLIF